MSKRRDYVSGLYFNHLYPNSSANSNPANDRFALIEGMYVRILGELAMNRFKWEGLPDSVDVRFLELQLYTRALSVFYFDTDFDKFLALQGGPTGRVNMVQNPTAFQVVGNDFVSKTVSAVPRILMVGGIPMRQEPECVPIWANYLRRPDLDIIQVYSYKLAELDRTIEINSLNHRQPKMIASDENTKLSAVNIVRQIDEGQSIIQVNTGASGMGILPTVLDMGADPRALEGLHILRTRLWNECMGLLGINNANQDKKERLVSDEVDANNAQVESSKSVNLNARRMACDQINKRWNLNISVDYNVDNQPQYDTAPSFAGAEVE